MRTIAALIIAASAAMTAMAEPITLREAMQEFRNRGAGQVEGVLLHGVPVIKGTIEEQAFTASMFQCDVPDYACRVVIARSCVDMMSIGAAEALQLANTYNLQIEPRGYALVSRASSGSASLCVQSRYDLGGDSVFDMSETFEWRETVTEFDEFINQARRSAVARNLLTN
ncbi:hypothetical protein D1224_07445 [Henriciella barbarensis]|uniref:YbjN domain-containing protein n=1 Tax=Henriciella barbarensis TaxID=86342 RepID=A0A399R3M9_9PROT|nr:hypothetical protein [Henriciella barbarensis]RIJ24069.1 hypothetical protein D1224_07445 [Henriciella barbarensis]